MRRPNHLRLVPSTPDSSEPPFQLRVIRFANGERFPLLFRRGSPSPETAPLRFLLSQLRPRHLATKTMINCLRAVQFLLTWALAESISLRDRVNSGRFLSLAELDRLQYAARLHIGALPLARPPSPSPPLSTAERFYAPLPPPSEPPLLQSEFVRLFYGHKFLAWWADCRSAELAREPGRRREYDAEKTRFLKYLETRIPDPPADSGRRKGPPAAIIERVLEVICPGHPQNPWRSRAVQFRNYLFVRILMQTGLRLGEVLSLRLRCIQPSLRELHIIRAPDAPDDRRLIPPTVKGHSHIQPLWDLHDPLMQYIQTVRRTIPGAKRSPFLLVASHSGRELSDSGARRVLSDLARAIQYAGPLSPHVLRHAWNESFSRTMDACKIPEERQGRIREFLMGWADDSSASDIYNRRFIEEEARRVLKALHARFFPTQEGT